MSKTTRASFELTVASIFWGFGFIAMMWSLETLSPLATNFWRFLFASLISGFILLFLPSHWRFMNKALLKRAFLPGLFLSATLILQNWGLLYTTATKSSFITTLYVVLVPIVDAVVRKKGIRALHYLLTFLALLGTALIVQLESAPLNLGDLLTLGCAVAASLQIFWLSYKKDVIENAFVFNFFQCLWVTLFSLLGLFLTQEPLHLELNENSSKGLTSLVIGSTLIAFYFQVKAQKHLSSGVASLICLLESPFATLFAFWILGERMTLFQWLGVITIFSATATSVLIEPELDEQLDLKKP